MIGPAACPRHRTARGSPAASPEGEVLARPTSGSFLHRTTRFQSSRVDQRPLGAPPTERVRHPQRQPCAAASDTQASSTADDGTATWIHVQRQQTQRSPTQPISGTAGKSDGLHLGFLRHNSCGGGWGGRRLAMIGPALAAALLLATPLGPAAARIPTEVVLSDNGGGGGVGPSGVFQLGAPPSAVLAPGGSGAGTMGNADSLEPGPSGATRGSAPVPRRTLVAPGTMVGTPNYARGPGGASGSGQRSTAREAAEALDLLNAAREAVDGGLHSQALELYGRLVSEHPDLALAEYGRIGRAMMLYQVGRTSDSILALEDEEAVLRGAAEVHAALAALLYSERPNLALRAEEEWNLACLFDKRYSDPEWVRTNKHWPPRMISALQKFLSLS